MKPVKKGFSRCESVSVSEFVSSGKRISWQWKKRVVDDAPREQGGVMLLTGDLDIRGEKG